MAFCTNCGAVLSADARFCPACGQAVGAVAAAAPAYVVPKLEYNIQGQNLQVARVSLKAGQEVYAEAGKMIYKTPNIQWETRMSGSSISEKIWGAVKRKLMGESLFLTNLRASGEAAAGLDDSYSS